MSFVRCLVLLTIMSAVIFPCLAQENNNGNPGNGNGQNGNGENGNGQNGNGENGNGNGGGGGGGENPQGNNGENQQGNNGGNFEGNRGEERVSSEKPWDNEVGDTEIGGESNANEEQQLPMVLPWNRENRLQTEIPLPRPYLSNQPAAPLYPPIYNPGVGGQIQKLALPNEGSPNQLSPYSYDKLLVQGELPWNGGGER